MAHHHRFFARETQDKYLKQACELGTVLGSGRCCDYDPAWLRVAHFETGAHGPGRLGSAYIYQLDRLGILASGANIQQEAEEHHDMLEKFCKELLDEEGAVQPGCLEVQPRLWDNGINTWRIYFLATLSISRENHPFGSAECILRQTLRLLFSWWVLRKFHVHHIGFVFTHIHVISEVTFCPEHGEDVFSEECHNDEPARLEAATKLLHKIGFRRVGHTQYFCYATDPMHVSRTTEPARFPPEPDEWNSDDTIEDDASDESGPSRPSTIGSSPVEPASTKPVPEAETVDQGHVEGGTIESTSGSDEKEEDDMDTSW